MTEKGEYDVLRLIEHNQVCYISSGCIRGTPLMGWLKYHRVMKKQEFVRMVRLLARQLEKIHRCRKQKFYQYVNPYSVVAVSYTHLDVYKRQGSASFSACWCSSGIRRARYFS